MAYRTTHGQTLSKGNVITIRFGYLDETNVLHEIELDVDAYALILARDLVTACVDQADCEGIV